MRDEIASQLCPAQPGLRVLFMSGSAAPVLAAAGSLEADHPVLDRPFSRSELLIKVVQVLEQPPTPFTHNPLVAPALDAPPPTAPVHGSGGARRYGEPGGALDAGGVW